MMLHVHKDRTDTPTLVHVANDFVGEKENRKQLFSKFSAGERYPNETSSLFRQSQHKRRKIRGKNTTLIEKWVQTIFLTKSILDECSDLTCTKQYALTKGPKRGEG